MTGRYAFRTGVGFLLSPRRGQALSPEEVTYPEILSQHGYACGLVGKWHLGTEETIGPTCPHGAGCSYYAVSVSRKFRCRESYYCWTKVENGVVSKCCNYNTSETIDDALKWIHCQDKPWMCTVAFNAPHSPWHEPPAHLHGCNLNGLSPRRHPRAFYLAAVQAMDTEIGRLLEGLGPAATNTTVIFVGDNGTPPGAIGPPYSPMEKRFGRTPLRERVLRDSIKVATGKHRAKGTVYQGGVHVPLIVTGPVVRRPGRESEALVHTVDLFATILELGGIDMHAESCPLPRLDSVSITPYLIDSELGSIRDTAYTEIFIGDHDKHGAVAIRNARYKLIVDFWIGRREYGLYDLLADPLECRNLLCNGACAPDQQSAFQSLLTEMRLLRQSSH